MTPSTPLDEADLTSSIADDLCFLPPDREADQLTGLKILVVGLGTHGGGTDLVKFLTERGAIVSITDLSSAVASAARAIEAAASSLAAATAASASAAAVASSWSRRCSSATNQIPGIHSATPYSIFYRNLISFLLWELSRYIW